MTTFTETERKYEVEPGAALPRLDKVSGVVEVGAPATATLQALYFDTADLRLLRNGMTLRRRTGGDDAGWHLKVPTGKDTRDKLREPLNGESDEPPKALRELTAGLTRGVELQAVARVDTDRVTCELRGKAGRVLAEVTDDMVTATGLTGASVTDDWRELEVELPADGDAKVLDRVEKVLRRAGVNRSNLPAKVAKVLPIDAPEWSGGTAGDVVLGYLSQQFAAILRHDLGARRGADDAVHQLRVAARRMRSILRVYGKVLDRSLTQELVEDLRWLGRRLSTARDLEVQESHFREEVAALPDELVLGPVAARLTRHFAPAVAAAQKKVLKTLNSDRYRSLLDGLDALLIVPPLTGRASRPAHKELPKQLRTAYRKTLKRVDAAPEGDGRDRGLHGARKAAKRFRAGAECVEPVIGKKAQRTRKQAKSLTKLLGEHQDAVLARPVLRELGAQAYSSAENGFTFGLLYERENERERQVERELPAMTKAFTDKNTRSWLG